MITIITVCKDDFLALKKTLRSVALQNYDAFEYVIIDGGNCEKTTGLIQEYKELVDHYINEPDFGIYHAMNKGIALAKGQWLLFMNAGDIFATNDALAKALDVAGDNADVVYSDWIYSYSQRMVKANIKKLNVRHQSVIYRKSLHDEHGNYVVGKRVSISDYIFFLSIAHKQWKYSPTVISICDETGISSKPMHFYQRIASEMIFGKRSRLNASFIFLAYPFYRFFKRNILNIKQ